MRSRTVEEGFNFFRTVSEWISLRRSATWSGWGLSLFTAFLCLSNSQVGLKEKSVLR